MVASSVGAACNRRPCPLKLKRLRSTERNVGGGVVNVVSDQLYEDYKTLMREYAAIFTNTKYFHIGCDETDAGAFASIPGYSDFVRKHNISDVNDLFAYYVATLASYARELGFTPVLWAGGNIGRLSPKDAVVMVWEGGAQQYINAGLPVVNCPGMDGQLREYFKPITDFGNGEVVPSSPLIIGGEALLWEVGWRKGTDCYYGAPCTPFLDFLAGRQSGQLWYAATDPANRPANATFLYNYDASHATLGRLNRPGTQCEGAGPLHQCAPVLPFL
jgi:hypothetical protein